MHELFPFYRAYHKCNLSLMKRDRLNFYRYKQKWPRFGVTRNAAFRQVINPKCPHGRGTFAERISPFDPVNWSIFAALFFPFTLANPRSVVQCRESSRAFSALRVAPNLIISEKNDAPAHVRVCVAAADRVPEQTLFFAKPLSTLTLAAAGARRHVTARRCTSHRRRHRSRASLSTMPQAGK